jgi:hypothetical protein
MDERRTNTRIRTLKGAKIAFGQGAAFDCVVRNLSCDGACLEVAGPLGIPQTFTLVHGSNHASHPCRIVWRTEHRIGVSFD